MSLKVAVNSALYRVTGYTLTRETPSQRQEAIRQAARAAAERARQQTAEWHRRRAAERAAQWKERQAERRRAERAKRAEAVLRAERRGARNERKRQAELRAQRKAERDAAAAQRKAMREGHHDEEARAILERVAPRTMTGAPKVWSLIEATRYVVRQQIPGDVVECGVWRGGSMQAVALTLLSLGESSRELHLFDTFEGMPPPSEEDTRTLDGEKVTAEQMLATSDKDSKLWAVAGLEDVKEGMAETGYPAEKVHFHPGLVEDTTPAEAPEQIAILRLDTDWYASTKHELEHLYERLSPGGILVIDDYGDWEGARKAVDEFLDKTGEALFLCPMGTGRIAIKPFERGD